MGLSVPAPWTSPWDSRTALSLLLVSICMWGPSGANEVSFSARRELLLPSPLEASFRATRLRPDMFRRRPAYGRIVGGSAVEIEKYPYQVSFTFFHFHICGASLISEFLVLTAAHCTEGKPTFFTWVRGGTSTRMTGGQESKVKRVHQHPEYSRVRVNNDLAVLVLEDNMILGPKLQPIPLANPGDEIPAGTEGVVTGWGVLQPHDNELPPNLQMVKLARISEADCVAKFGRLITKQMICFGYLAGGRDACQGDSGGPLVVNGKQVGITSWGIECALPNMPGVFTNIANLRPYIDGKVKEETELRNKTLTVTQPKP